MIRRSRTKYNTQSRSMSSPAFRRWSSFVPCDQTRWCHPVRTLSSATSARSSSSRRPSTSPGHSPTPTAALRSSSSSHRELSWPYDGAAQVWRGQGIQRYQDSNYFSWPGTGMNVKIFFLVLFNGLLSNFLYRASPFLIWVVWQGITRMFSQNLKKICLKTSTFLWMTIHHEDLLYYLCT